MRKIWLTVFIAGALILWLINLFIALNANNNSSNLWGDAFGIANSLFSFFAFAGVLYSLHLQRKEQEGQKKDYFENTFFKMLNQLQNITNSAVSTLKHPDNHPMSSFQPSVIKGNEYYSIVFKEFYDQLKNMGLEAELALRSRYDNSDRLTELLISEFPFEAGDTSHSNKLVSIKRCFDEYHFKDAIRTVDKEDIRKYIEIVYGEFIKKHTDNLDHFYRYLNSLLKFIDKQTTELKIESKFYFKLVQAQLTNAQLALLFYSSITSVAKNANGEFEFARILDSSQLLENLPGTHCHNRRFVEFYPNTQFKFLS